MRTHYLYLIDEQIDFVARSQMKKGKTDHSSIPLKEIGWVLIFSVILVGLHIWGALQPEHLNWGFHLLGFYPPYVGILLLFLAIAILVPGIEQSFIAALDKSTRFLGRLPVSILLLLAAGAVIGGAFLFPVKMHLLGDGAVLLRSNAMAEWGSDLKASFANQPLMRLIYRSVLNLYSGANPASPHQIYFWIDIGAGAAYVYLLFWFFRRADLQPVDSLLAALILGLSASSQFFFGYVENYVLQFVVVTFFLLSGWLSLRGSVSVLVPLTAFFLLAGLHLGFLILGPAVLFLLLHRLRGRRTVTFAALGGLLLAGAGFLILVGFNLRGFLRHITSGSVDFLQPFSAIGGNFPYPMFSVRHFWDWLNSGLLTAPFGLAIAAGLLITRRRDLQWKDPVLIFLLLAAGFGLLFTWIVNFALGMARDWDLFSTFIVPLLALDVYLLFTIENAALRRYVMAVVVVLTALHWGAWIGINANAGRHLARMRLLGSPVLLSPVSQMVYDEALANYFFDNGEYTEARHYYEHLMTIDDKNPRIVGNMADTYRKLGQRELYFAMLKRAVEIKSTDPGVYSNIGVEYAMRKDTTKAIEFNEQALTFDSTYRLAHANLGILYAGRGQLARAEDHLQKAIFYGMRDASLFRYAGEICAVNSHFERALQFYNSYLEMVPGDRAALAARERIRAYLPPAGSSGDRTTAQ